MSDDGCQTSSAWRHALAPCGIRARVGRRKQANLSALDVRIDATHPGDAARRRERVPLTLDDVFNGECA